MLAFLVAAQAFVADRFDKKNDRGATAVEYGIMVAAIAAVIIAAVIAIGVALGNNFSFVETSLETLPNS